jgi:Ser/Thr protein kinase RdoA (MazF antagonist)
MFEPILSAYGFPADCEVRPHGTGLINRTWLIHGENGNFILQQINQEVFTRPTLIADNIQRVSNYLGAYYPAVVFPRPAKTLSGQTLLWLAPDSYFRVYPFIENSVTIDVAGTPSQAYEAAKQFGALTRMLSGFPADSLHQTLPGFHDLSRRYRDFRLSLGKGNLQRIHKAAHLIDYLEAQSNIVSVYENICKDQGFRRRVTHHDTKISNVLFDQQGKGICVIDLDTMMAGYFISDVGDMLRTYLSPVSEEEQDIGRIEIRQSFFQAIVEGYMQEMRDELTATEKESFIYAGEFMMYMQALRFLTDYLYEDIYYGRKYEDHNYVRALNQATLLQRFQEMAPLLKKMVREA